jgi:lipopolysaccharide export LptBFGC system permease protein LptF
VTTSLLLGWVVPIANQEWRTTMFAMFSKNPTARAPVKGIRELTIPELLSEPAHSPRYATAQREIHKRAALAASPITLGAIGWVLWRPRRKRVAVVFIAWVIGAVSFYQLSIIGRGAEDAYSLFAGAGFWLAHLLALAALALYSIYRPKEKGGSKDPPLHSLAP